MVEASPASGGPADPHGSRRRKIAVGAALTVAILFGAWAALGSSRPLDEDPRGQVAPTFQLPQLDDGRPFSLSELSGRPVVLNFWASWCHTCRQEAPVLAAGFTRWGGKGVEFLGVDSQDSRSWDQEFVRTYGIGFRNVTDETGTVGAGYGITGHPETFFIDRDGRIVAKWIGPIDRATLDGYIADMLAAGGTK